MKNVVYLGPGCRVTPTSRQHLGNSQENTPIFLQSHADAVASYSVVPYKFYVNNENSFWHLNIRYIGNDRDGPPSQICRFLQSKIEVS